MKKLALAVASSALLSMSLTAQSQALSSDLTRCHDEAVSFCALFFDYGSLQWAACADNYIETCLAHSSTGASLPFGDTLREDF